MITPTRRDVLAILAAAGLPGRWPEDEDDGRRAMKIFQTKDLSAERAKTGRPYLKFLDEPTMSMGVYHLPRGSIDPQAPHEEDEAYYVLEGAAKFEVEEKDGRRSVEPVGPGTVLFVGAFVAHKFLDIEKDLTLLVFFSKAPVKRPE